MKKNQKKLSQTFKSVFKWRKSYKKKTKKSREVSIIKKRSPK